MAGPVGNGGRGSICIRFVVAHMGNSGSPASAWGGVKGVGVDELLPKRNEVGDVGMDEVGGMSRVGVVSRTGVVFVCDCRGICAHRFRAAFASNE